jgi:hypothetical protein
VPGPFRAVVEVHPVKNRHWSVALAALSIGFVLWCAAQRESLATAWGDESTYLAMAESLARDGDLRFTESDAARLERAEHGTVILQQTASGVAYSKPVLYAFLVAPAVLVLGGFGPVLVNALCLLAAAWLGWRFLARIGDPGQAALVVVTFVGASVLLPHVGWRMTDLLQATLALSGLVMSLAVLRPAADGVRTWLDGRWAAALGGLLLGLLVSSRLPYALVLLAALAALVVGGRSRRALGVLAAGVAGVLVLGLASQISIGAGNPYKAQRSTFDAKTGYPIAANEEVLDRFEEHGRTQLMKIKPIWRHRVSAYSTLYFFVGRHTGVLWYFPALIALAMTALIRPDRVSASLWLGAGVAAAFYLIWLPDNYFGGASFLGNRYFLPIYPLALVALPRLPGRWSLGIAWAIALVMGASAVASFRVAPNPAASQSHTLAGLPRRLPYESTARNIEGRRDRYWARDMVRFVDGRGSAGADDFTLEAGARAAEVMLVTRRRESPMLLHYRTKAAGLSLVVEDRGSIRTYPLEGAGKTRRGALTLELGSAWRWHRFWFNHHDPYAVRMVRLSVVGENGTDPQGRNATATFAYGGDPEELERVFQHTGPGVWLPKRAKAGGTTELKVRVRNMSPVPWASSGGFPVKLSYRLEPVGDDASPAIEGPRVPLPADLPSGDPVNLVLPVTWPEEPGAYRLEVDLVIEDFAWFATRVGKPLASGEVRVASQVPARR